MIANEIVDESQKLKKKGVIFKVDFAKAYDFVFWEFLEFIMGKTGFSIF